MSTIIYKMSKSEAGKLGAEKTKLILAAKKQKRIDEYNKNPKICPACQKPLSYDDSLRKKKFHNQSCSASYNNSKRKHLPTCLNCENKVNATNNVYCSLQCQQDYNWEKRKLKVIDGNGTNGNVKRYLLESNGHTCNKCKNTTWNNQSIPLELEHKNGNSDDNSLENVELLCPNCHAQTSTYKAKNKGNGRWKRRQRYIDGKSY